MHLQEGIQPVAPDDYPQIVTVWEESVRATHHFVSEADINFFRTLVRDGIPHLQHLLCIRAENGQVAGFIGLVGDKIEMLFIHPDYRSKGLGRLLIRHAVDILLAEEVDVNEQNTQAVGFYQHMGFEVCGRSELDAAGKPYPILHMQLRYP
jgi:putative acetyltransferase